MYMLTWYKVALKHPETVSAGEFSTGIKQAEAAVLSLMALQHKGNKGVCVGCSGGGIEPGWEEGKRETPDPSLV